MTTERVPRPTTYYELVFDGVDYEINAYAEDGDWFGQWRCGRDGQIVGRGEIGPVRHRRAALAAACDRLLWFHFTELPPDLAARSTALVCPDLSDEEPRHGDL